MVLAWVTTEGAESLIVDVSGSAEDAAEDTATAVAVADDGSDDDG